MTQTAAQLLREGYKQFVENGIFPNKIAIEINLQLKKMYLAKYNYNNDCDEIVQQAFINIYTDIIKKNSGSIWESTLEETEENDKRLIANIYKIFITSRKEIEPDLWKKETINLKRAISKIIEQLVDDKKLTQDGKYYHLPKTPKPLKGYIYNFPNILFSIRNSNGELNWGKIENLILLIFEEYLEKYSLSLSNILEIIIKIADVGNESLISKDENNDDDESEIIQIENNDISAETYTNVNEVVKIWIDRAKGKFNEEQFSIRAKIFVLKYGENYTLSEIVDKMYLGVGTSSVDNYVKLSSFTRLFRKTCIIMLFQS